MIRRFLLTARAVDRCPPPTFDTGCTHCQIPSFPEDKQIDLTKDLRGTMAAHWKHVLIVSKESHKKWPSKLELTPGSIDNEMALLKKKWQSPMHPVMISRIDTGEHMVDLKDEGYKIMVYPDRKTYNVKEEQFESFFRSVLVPHEIEVEPVYNPFVSRKEAKIVQSTYEKFVGEEEDIEQELIAICGHEKRDVRCGVLAPLIKDEFDKVLEHHGINDKIQTVYISHIGGHAYAGNVLYFGKDQTIWYGRVMPNKVQGIVQETLINGNLISELVRN
mgnify:CR=1 FL=1